MQVNPKLEKLIQEVLEKIHSFGLCSELNKQYKRTYDRLRDFAKRRNTDSFSSGLIERFLEFIEHKYETGKIGRNRRNHLRRATLLLRDYAVNGGIDWKTYTFNSPSLPSSPVFLYLYSQYIDTVKSYGWSKNTIQSSRNLVRQFLIFLEDCGFSTLAMAAPRVIPSFFKHLLAKYSIGSIRTVTSHIRSFLNFAEGGKRLLPLVPSRCIRINPIMPILSNYEYDALTSVLQTPILALRDRAIILLALRTGLRAVDIVGMKLKDIDWINDTISVTQPKTGNPFLIPLPTDVGNIVSSYILNERPKTDNPFVFLRTQGPYRPLSGHSTCYQLVCKAFHQAGIRLGNERKGIHIIRHSTASRMLSKEVPVTTISSILGHSNKASTDIYLATDENRMRECALDLTEIPLTCEALK